MKHTVFSAFALLSFTVPLSAQTNWSGINVKPSPIPVLTATNGELGVNTFENYTIPYKLRGTLSLATAIPLMTTADGRRFLLVGPRADGLTALDGKKIYVEGKVKELDDRDELLVTRIDLSSRVPFESRKILPWQKRAYLINKDGATYTVGNMNRFFELAGDSDFAAVMANGDNCYRLSLGGFATTGCKNAEWFASHKPEPFRICYPELGAAQ